MAPPSPTPQHNAARLFAELSQSHWPEDSPVNMPADIMDTSLSGHASSHVKTAKHKHDDSGQHFDDDSSPIKRIRFENEEPNSSSSGTAPDSVEASQRNFEHHFYQGKQQQYLWEFHSKRNLDAKTEADNAMDIDESNSANTSSSERMRRDESSCSSNITHSYCKPTWDSSVYNHWQF